MIRLPGDDLHQHRVLSSIWRATALTGLLSLLGGCGTLGSATIVSTRTPVNEAVATTARQQTLMNIVRVYHNESPMILDIAEADDLVTVAGSATGGVTGFGSPINSTSGQTGSVGGIVSAADAVTNRYIPLQGQALISQLSSQIKVETLNALYDSQWPLQSILEFAVDRLSPAKDDFRVAADLLTQLDADDAISIASAKSIFSAGAPKSRNMKAGENIFIQQGDNSSTGGDTLNIYLTQKNMMLDDPRQNYNATAWKRLRELYAESQPDERGNISTISGKLSNVIELRNSPITNTNNIKQIGSRGTYLGPVMRTRTAIGILKYIVRQPKVSFITAGEYAQILQYPWNQDTYFKKCPEADSYILDPRGRIGRQSDDKELYFHQELIDNNHAEFIVNFLNQASFPQPDIKSKTPTRPIECVYSFPTTHSKQDIRNYETTISALRRYILVIVSDSPINGAFTSWYDGTNYFSIMMDDRISQRNLMLISQFLTIQATTTPSPALTTVSTNGH